MVQNDEKELKPNAHDLFHAPVKVKELNWNGTLSCHFY